MKPNRVRLASGRFKGVSIEVPRGVRPTSGKVRQALLDAWQFRLPEAAVLELFAGSGAVGLEALGRGAASLLAIDGDTTVVSALRRAAARLEAEAVEVRRARLPGDLEAVARGRRFDLVFADPPYDFTAFVELLAAVVPLLSDDGEIVLEHSRRSEVPERLSNLERVAERRYGESVLSVYRPRK